MRETKRIYAINPRGALQRSADGTLKPASTDRDIADIWAEQKRIRLKEAIEERQRQELKKQQKRQPLQGISPSGLREIEINLRLPKLRLPSADDIIDWTGTLHLPAFVKKRRGLLITAGALLILLLVALPVSARLLHHDQKLAPLTGGGAGTPTTQQQSSAHVSQKPTFATILPSGKTIQDLGGWGRVSPANAAPAFGYSDMVGGVHVVVSEQQIPASFDLSNVARQFGASQRATATDGTQVYSGTAGNNVSEAIAAKKGLLILIRSSGAVSSQQWLTYIASLK